VPEGLRPVAGIAGGQQPQQFPSKANECG
jgi:hypothetical protein